MGLNTLILALIIVIFKANDCNSESLSSYNVDPKEVSVSGISSGAFFVTQIQVAFSSIIKGAGIVAGGPYDCAGSNSYTTCMYSNTPPIATSISRTNQWSGSKIDNKDNMSHQKIYMISGTSDSTVGQSVMNQLYKYYVTDGGYIPSSNVIYKKDLKSAHTFPTDFDSIGNNGCGTASSPYISNCNFDGAGEILKHIYGNLNPRNNGQLSGKFIQFNQGEFISNPNSNGMDNNGWIYVPESCGSGHKCKLHLAFHGCVQGYASIGDKFVKNTGFTKWADTNNIVVVFPQAVATYTMNVGSRMLTPNMNGCWDWIGWYGNDFSVKSGKQLTAIKKMIDRITEGHKPGDNTTEKPHTDTTHTNNPNTTPHPTPIVTPPPVGKCYDDNNYNHANAGRAYVILGVVYANGSNEIMGLWNIFVRTKLRQKGNENYYTIVENC